MRITLATLCFAGGTPPTLQAQSKELPDTPTLEQLEQRLKDRVRANSLRMDSLSRPASDPQKNPGFGTLSSESQQERIKRETDDVLQKLKAKRDEDQRTSPQPKEADIDNQKKDSSVGTPSVKEAPTLAGDAAQMGPALLLSDVIASTYRAFPMIEIARLQSGVASGQQLSALGAYDLKVDYYSLNQPVGFYETFRQGIGVARQTWWGGYASAGYRIGRGSYEPWYKERETNDAGEFKVAWIQPLLQGRAIDPQRVELFQANLRQQAVAPEIQFQILIASQDAARAFWAWVEAGNALKVRERLLEIAEKRGKDLQKGKEAKLVASISILQNNQEILDRQAKVNDSRQKFRDTAFKLALFLRDEMGSPLLAPPEWLPPDFPELLELALASEEEDVNNAWAARPELQLLNIEMQTLRWDISLARNQTLPNLDFTIQSAQNIGEGTSSLNDKGEFQLEMGIIGGVPVQRSKARGNSRQASPSQSEVRASTEQSPSRYPHRSQRSRVRKTKCNHLSRPSQTIERNT
jgi:hypothetical protein